MVNKTQWVLSAMEVAEHVASISPRSMQRAYLVADGGMLNSVVVVTSLKTAAASGNYSIDDKRVVRVNKADVLAFLTTSGETLPGRTRMFVRPDTALQPTVTTALELVVTDDSNLGSV